MKNGAKAESYEYYNYAFALLMMLLQQWKTQQTLLMDDLAKRFALKEGSSVKETDHYLDADAKELIHFQCREPTKPLMGYVVH